MQYKKGFTLIELLVVIAIIGVLASIVLASLNTARQKARDARRVADIKQIQLALELFADANLQKYPDTVAAMIPTYLPSEPKDPTTGVSYPYDNYTNSSRGTCVFATGTCLFYHLGGTLEEGTNQAMKSDRDFDGKIDGGPDGVSANGACALDAANTAPDDPDDRCYDVTP